MQKCYHPNWAHVLCATDSLRSDNSLNACSEIKRRYILDGIASVTGIDAVRLSHLDGFKVTTSKLH